MKPGIHPQYFDKAQIICACGAVLETGSTQKEMHIEICANCHPFYTGKKKVVDTTGRVDRFKKLTERAQALKTARKPKTTRKKEKSEAKEAKKEKASAEK
jgi:large subunit ribosomal protein L31